MTITKEKIIDVNFASEKYKCLMEIEVWAGD